ncbi:MAG: Spo0E family sporulation regulatory protein-aspartic acid phosphatase [Bacillota bacterium]
MSITRNNLFFFQPARYRNGPLSTRLAEVTQEIKHLKRKVAVLYEAKGFTDQEVLRLAEKIDSLLNEYDLLLQKDCR